MAKVLDIDEEVDPLPKAPMFPWMRQWFYDAANAHGG
jgi:hypothetical protein